MERNKIHTLLSESIDSIYGFALSKTGNKTDAEDLANDICLQILSSYKNLNEDSAFYGFMWSVARNTYKKFLRRKNHTPAQGSFIDIDYNTPESEYIDNEEISLLRREMSLLSKKYREITVSFYIDGKSGAQISQELNISPEMVRNILFKVRKMLKEGIEMKREYGEKSYNPIKLYHNSWGNRCYLADLFKKLLPCNILYAAYENPVTIEEMSLALGVSAPYLEDELKTLVDSGVISEQGGKYSSNIVILTGEFEKSMYASIKNGLTSDIAGIAKALQSKIAAVRDLNFTGCQKTNSRILWLEVYTMLDMALGNVNDKAWESVGGIPVWADGSECEFWMEDNDSEYCSVEGIFGCWGNKDKSAWTGIYNYKQIKPCQYVEPKWNNLSTFEIMADVAAGKSVDRDNLELIKLIDEGIIKASDGKLFANFPVMNELEFAHLKEILADCIDLAEEAIKKAIKIGMELAEKSVPKRLCEKGKTAVMFDAMINTTGIIVDMLLENTTLTLPDSKEGLCVIGVVK